MFKAASLIVVLVATIAAPQSQAARPLIDLLPEDEVAVTLENIDRGITSFCTVTFSVSNTTEYDIANLSLAIRSRVDGCRGRDCAHEEILNGLHAEAGRVQFVGINSSGVMCEKGTSKFGVVDLRATLYSNAKKVDSQDARDFARKSLRLGSKVDGIELVDLMN